MFEKHTSTGSVLPENIRGRARGADHGAGTSPPPSPSPSVAQKRRFRTRRGQVPSLIKLPDPSSGDAAWNDYLTSVRRRKGSGAKPGFVSQFIPGSDEARSPVLGRAGQQLPRRSTARSGRHTRAPSAPGRQEMNGCGNVRSAMRFTSPAGNLRHERNIKTPDSMRDLRRSFETIASKMRRDHTSSSRDDRRWMERRSKTKERIAGMMEDATRFVAQELHNNMVDVERQKLRTKRRMKRLIPQYEQRWEAFATSTNEITVADIPFPPDLSNPLCLGAAHTSSEKKAAFRKGSLRWHPDKFMAKFGGRIPDSEREPIENKCKEVFQCVNEAWNS